MSIRGSIIALVVVFVPALGFARAEGQAAETPAGLSYIEAHRR